MATSKKNNIYFCIYIFLINLSFISCVIEMPLQAIKVKGIPKYQNFTIIEPVSPLIEKNGTFYYQEGNAQINFENLFFASIKIGSNSQPFNLILDTGSSVLWVTHSNCGKECSNSINRHYNPDSSTSCDGPYNSFSIQYGTGSVTGDYYNDNIEYISNKQFNMYFGVASKAYFQVTNCDGIIGLSKSYDDERLSFIHMLKKDGNTDSSAFSIKFENDIFEGGVKGAMYIGEHEDFSKSETVSCPLVYYGNKIFWAGEINSFTLKNSDHEVTSNKKIYIIFDTGTNFIILPMKYLNDIEKDLSSFGCYRTSTQNGYQIACQPNNNLPDLRFEINGNTLIFPRTYAFYSNGNKKYVYSMIIFSDSSISIMGSIFFFLFHTLFDEENKELKFYPLKGEVESGLSTFVIVLIVICAIAFAIAIALIVYYYVKRYKEKKNMLQGNLGTKYCENLVLPPMD